MFDSTAFPKFFCLSSLPFSVICVLHVCMCVWMSVPMLQLEQFGVLRVWRASDYFGLILETDVENLTQLGSRFMTSKLSIDDGMEVVRIECE